MNKSNFTYRALLIICIVGVVLFIGFELTQLIPFNKIHHPPIKSGTKQHSVIVKEITVLDNQNNPLSSAAIHMSWGKDSHYDTKTDADGRFVINTAEGLRTLIFRKSGYRSLKANYRFRYHDFADLVIILMPKTGKADIEYDNLPLKNTLDDYSNSARAGYNYNINYCTMAGYITDETGMPLNNIDLDIGNRDAREGNPLRTKNVPSSSSLYEKAIRNKKFYPFMDNFKGYYIITGFKPGLNQIYIFSPCHWHCIAIMNIKQGDEILFSPSLKDGQYNYRPDKLGEGTLSGHITDESGTPLSDVHINVWFDDPPYDIMSQYDQVTNLNGDFVMRNLPKGNYTAHISRSSHNEKSGRIYVESGKETVVNYRINTNPEDEEWLKMFLASTLGKRLQRNLIIHQRKSIQ